MGLPGELSDSLWGAQIESLSSLWTSRLGTVWARLEHFFQPPSGQQAPSRLQYHFPSLPTMHLLKGGSGMLKSSIVWLGPAGQEDVTSHFLAYFQRVT